MGDILPPHHLRDRSDTRAKSQQSPDPQNAALIDFLEKLFAGDAFPEKIEVRQMEGAGCKRKSAMVEEYAYKPNASRPTREALVKLANEILRRCHEDCDGIGKPMRYGVLAYDSRRRDDYFRRLIVPLFPLGVDSGESDAGPSSEDEEGFDGLPPAQRFLLRAIAQVHQHNASMIEQFHGAMGAMIDRQERRLERNEYLLDQFVEKHFKLIEIVERSLSLEHERRQLEKWTDLKVEASRDGLTMVRGLLPAVVNHFAGRDILQGPSPVALAVDSFIQNLSREQLLAAFGYDSEKGEYVQEGIFSREQSALLSRIAQGQVSEEALEAFVVSVRSEQLVAAQQLFGEKLVPLLALAQSMIEKKRVAPKETPKA